MQNNTSGTHWLQQVTDITLLKDTVYTLEQELLEQKRRVESDAIRTIWEITKQKDALQRRVVILNKQIEETKRTASRAYRDMQDHLDYPDYDER